VGGFGSGRWDWHTKAQTVEGCLCLDANRWAREGVLRAGARLSGSSTWWRDAERKEQAASIEYEVNTLDPARPWFLLSYATARTGEPLVYCIALQTTRPRFGGVRWWFTCPLVADDVSCDRRVAKLYLPPGGRYFGCRECYRLTYRSAQEHDARVGALLKDPGALEAGLQRGLSDMSPRGMRRTFLLLKASGERLRRLERRLAGGRQAGGHVLSGTSMR
jgi:hypothetical protein